jgi:hypothetical protein
MHIYCSSYLTCSLSQHLTNFKIRHPRWYLHAKVYFTVINSTVTTNTHTCKVPKTQVNTKSHQI